MTEYQEYPLSKVVTDFYINAKQPSFKTQTKEGLVDLIYNTCSYYMAVITDPKNYVQLDDGTLIPLKQFYNDLMRVGFGCCFQSNSPGTLFFTMYKHWYINKKNRLLFLEVFFLFDTIHFRGVNFNKNKE